MVRDGMATFQQNPNQITTNMIFMPTMFAHQSMITMRQLLDILDTRIGQSNPGPGQSLLDIAARDQDWASCLGRSLDPTRQERISIVMQDRHFQEWFKSSHSLTLVINGMEMESHWQESVSTTSYMCYLLSQTLSRLQISNSLTFYCGLHSMPGERIEGVDGMLRSIIAQLLQAYGDQINLSFLDFSMIQELQNHSVRQLCLLLESLLSGIGIGVVFLMIDGISWYEVESRMQETTLVMQFLNSLVENVESSHTGFVMKLLITSPVMSRYSREWFPTAFEVSMQGGLLTGVPQGGFDEYQMLTAGQNVLGAEDQPIYQMQF